MKVVRTTRDPLNFKIASRIRSKLGRIGIRIVKERYIEEGGPVTVLYLSKPISPCTLRRVVQEVARELGYNVKLEKRCIHIDLEEEGVISVTAKGRKIEVIGPYTAPEEFNAIVEEEEEIADWFLANYTPPAEIDLETGEDVENYSRSYRGGRRRKY